MGHLKSRLGRLEAHVATQIDMEESQKVRVLLELVQGDPEMRWALKFLGSLLVEIEIYGEAGANERLGYRYPDLTERLERMNKALLAFQDHAKELGITS